MECGLNGKNKTKAMNIWTVSVMRHGSDIFGRTKNKLEKTDGKTKEVMRMNKELLPKSDIDILYVTKYKWGKESHRIIFVLLMRKTVWNGTLNNRFNLWLLLLELARRYLVKM